jgi:hypothetical protein
MPPTAGGVLLWDLHEREEPACEGARLASAAAALTPGTSLFRGRRIVRILLQVSHEMPILGDLGRVFGMLAVIICGLRRSRTVPHQAGAVTIRGRVP